MYHQQGTVFHFGDKQLGLQRAQRFAAAPVTIEQSFPFKRQ